MKTRQSPAATRWTKLVLLTALGAALAACGGGGGGGVPTPPSVSDLGGSVATPTPTPVPTPTPTPSSDGALSVPDGLKAHFERLSRCPEGGGAPIRNNLCAAGTYHGHDFTDPDIPCSLTIGEDGTASFRYGEHAIPPFRIASGRYDNNLWNGEGQLLNISGNSQNSSQSYDLRLSNRPLTEISLTIEIYNGGVTNGGPNLNNMCIITH